MNIQDSKIELRARIRAQLERISLAVRTVESMDLCARLEPQLQSAHTILFYAPMVHELDVWPLLEKLLKSSKVCALPAFDATTQLYCARRVKNLQTDVLTGKFGVPEPWPECELIPLNQFNLVIVPGMAFDLQGHRLGRGKGFYDRILSAAGGIKCGVGYELQLVENITTEPHDAKVDFILTPDRCIKARRNP